MRTLITGASGYLGSNLAHDLAGEFEVVGSYHSRLIEIPGVQMVQTDLVDLASVDSVIEKHSPDLIVHCAAQADIGAAQERPTEAEQINRIGTENLLASLPPEAYVIHISTDNVYDGTKGWYDESDEPAPIHTYGKTKLAAEEAVRRFGGDWSILRVTLLYGGRPEYPRQFCDQTYLRLKRGERITLFVDEYRTPLFVPDVARVIRKMVEKRPSGELFNLAGPDRVSRVEFGEMLAELKGLDGSLIDKVTADSVPRRVQRPRDLSMRSDKICSTLGMSLTPLKEGIERGYE